MYSRPHNMIMAKLQPEKDSRPVLFFVSCVACTRDQCVLTTPAGPKGSSLPALGPPDPKSSPGICCSHAGVPRQKMLSVSCQRRDHNHHTGDEMPRQPFSGFTMAVACCPAETQEHTPALDCCRDSGFCPVSRGSLCHSPAQILLETLLRLGNWG
ncbi:hypothetical protein I79_025749 [Cricetulus griseus]|uniref:Uncharacterized protein n=1 Tax=Cricetulus griseus TaxID=10029 RepID=G3IP46_CRIGR|nr:hypothetical protein I79_025749 [Cricetulus griseus]